MEQSSGLLADQVDAAAVVDVVDVVPGDALCSVFLLGGDTRNTNSKVLNTMRFIRSKIEILLHAPLRY